MTRLHLSMTNRHGINIKNRHVGMGFAPLLKEKHIGGSIGVRANTPIGIITQPKTSIALSNGGSIRREYAKNLQNNEVDTKESLLDKISFGKKDRKLANKDNIKFVF